MRKVVFSFLVLGVLAMVSNVSAKSASGIATFAGGCFWCLEADLAKIPGVLKVTSGFSGGSVESPSYEDVTKGTTGHREVVQVEYDPSVLSYESLLDHFWKNIDPFDEKGQFCDKGFQYTAAIFIHDESQAKSAQTSKEKIENSGRFPEKIITAITSYKNFYPAEERHQKYAEKNPLKYSFYRWKCGRDARLKELWRPPSK